MNDPARDYAFSPAAEERVTALAPACAVKMENVTKRFGKVVANNAINLELREGEILSLLGENGSGKTTLMNMLSGIYFPDEGQIYIHGKPVTIASPKDAFNYGIGMIHQHFKLVDVFTATENIVLGLEGKLDLAEAGKKVKEICDKYGFDIDPNQKIYDMSVSQKQTVEIVKVLFRGADILILDEPTAVLTPQETDKLFQIMRNMKADGKSLIIITHKLHEVLDVSDRVAVLRKGEYIGDVATKDADQQSLTDMMVGHSVSLNIDRPDPVNVTPRLVLDGLTVFDELGVKRLDNVSFTVNAGEVLGVAGVAGSGQREPLESIAGLYPIASGSVTYYDPATGDFGALGHGITDGDTMALMPFGSGSILPSTVKAVKKGSSGSAGELRGNFDLSGDLGPLCANTDCGIFGTLPADCTLVAGEALPVGDAVEGSATIRANVSGDEVREYTVEILKRLPNASDGREMVISVTDPDLIAATGGIVQGMSGSPILQNGKLVGAVTHVLLSDATKGYGISMETMLNAGENV